MPGPAPEPLRPGVFEALRDLAREGPVEVAVRGSCMAPRIAEGQRVLVAAARIYWPGDILAFQAGDGRLRLHRLLAWRPHRGGIAFVTRGDHCPCHDDPVSKDRILGRIVEPVRLTDRLRALLSALRVVVSAMRGA